MQWISGVVHTGVCLNMSKCRPTSDEQGPTRRKRDERLYNHGLESMNMFYY